MPRKCFISVASAVSISLFAVPAWASAWLGHFADAPSLTKAAELAVGEWRDVKIVAKPVGTSGNAPKGTIETAPLVVGKLQFRGGLVITSPDKRFGGFSGLRLSDDGQILYAISDRGQWLTATVAYDDQRAIANLQTVRMATMMRHNGEALTGTAGDAESLELTPDGGAIVGFERYHRIDHYERDNNGRFAFRQRIFHNRLAEGLQDNSSLESLVLLGDGRVLTIAEGTVKAGTPTNEAGSLIAGNERPGWVSPPAIWFEGGDDWRPLAYQPADEFSVTDLARDKQSDDVYVLERAYSRTKGVRVRVTRLSLKDVQSGAILSGEEVARLSMIHGIDNFEGMDLRRTDDGRLMLYLLSDDNFSITQRTILMSWEVLE